MDFNEQGIMIELPPEDRERLKKQIEMDAKFCAGAKVIDYSLLLGIHYIKDGILFDKSPMYLTLRLILGDPFATPPQDHHTTLHGQNPMLLTPSFNATMNQGLNQNIYNPMNSNLNPSQFNPNSQSQFSPNTQYVTTNLNAMQQNGSLSAEKAPKFYEVSLFSIREIYNYHV